MSGAIVASDVRLERHGSTLRLSCAVRDPDGLLPDRLWYELDERHEALIRPHADGFLPALTTAAMARGRPLHIDGSVAAEHLEGCAQVMAVYLRYSAEHGDGLTRVAVTAASTRAGDARGPVTAAFFSAGVDSFYTLLWNHARYPKGDSRRISHLLVLHGYDLALDDRSLFARLLRECDEIGERVDAVPVAIRTNLRAALPKLHWNRYGFGTVMSSVALALAPGVHTAYVPSGGRSFVELATRYFAIQPEIASWWSARSHELVYDPLHLPRREKVRFLAQEAWPVPYLRVCWENRGGAYNCGECEKCNRTMVELTLAGAPVHGSFPTPLDLERLGAQRIDPLSRTYWQELCAQAEALPEHAALAQTLRRMLAASAWTESRMGRVDTWLSGVLTRIGLTSERAKALDARLLRGLGTAVYRSTRSSVAGSDRRSPRTTGATSREREDERP